MFEKESAFTSLASLSKVKQQEIVCPISKLRMITTPLLGSDDLMLRTTISAVDTYDFELSKLLFLRCTFPEVEAAGQKLEYDQFVNGVSYIDKQVILWGIYKASYGTLGNQNVSCTHCENVFEAEIDADEVLQDDSLYPWDQAAPFNQFRFPIELKIDNDEIDKLVFQTSLPTIKEHQTILSIIPPSKLRENFNKFGSIFGKPEELSVVTRSIEFYKKGVEDKDGLVEEVKPIIWSSTMEIHDIVSRFLLLGMLDTVLDKYNEFFSKFVPRFRKPYTCNLCGKPFDHEVDMEIGLFRRFLQRDFI